MNHGSSHKGERALANAQGVAALDRSRLDAKMRADLVDARPSAGIDLRIRGDLVNHRQGAGVIHLNMVGDDHVDLGGIDHLGNALDELVRERCLARVDEGDLLIHDEISVIRDTAFGGIAVEQSLVPVDAANPPDLRGDLDCIQHVESFLPCLQPLIRDSILACAQKEGAAWEHNPMPRSNSGAISQGSGSLA